jgi:hypothetical protein
MEFDARPVQIAAGSKRKGGVYPENLFRRQHPESPWIISHEPHRLPNDFESYQDFLAEYIQRLLL